MQHWYLEGFQQDKNTIGRTNVNTFPFQIGRQDGLSLTLPSQSVSRIHAELTIEGNQIFIEDFGSSNGTFLNRIRISGKQPLSPGDVIRLADCELRIMQDVDDISDANQTVMLTTGMLQNQLLSQARLLDELISKQQVTTAYQPIVGKDAKTLVGYEILGRGAHPELSPSPGELFQIAETFSMAVGLSEIFRETGVATAANYAPNKYFLNIHPDELSDQKRLFQSLETLREQHPELSLVLEIHEEAVTNLNLMKQIKADLDQLQIELAYDDFGAGQGRLMELVEVPPDILKFDRVLIADIDQASPSRLKMLQLLVEITRDIGTQTLAECVETEQEVKVCQELEIDLFQGYFIDKPLAEPNRH